MNIIFSILSDTWIKFESVKVKGARTVWMDKSSSCKAAYKAEDFERFCSMYAYAAPSASCFQTVEFDRGDTKVLVAERYGGAGVGRNGGGGRCGNLGLVQLKGVGANCMVGSHDSEEHAYGGLDAHYAITETIYACVLNKVLPLGAVAVRGLIFTGEKTAFNFNTRKPCWGMILVRDPCIRPAHFMRSDKFKPIKKYENILIDDVARVRWMNRRFGEFFDGVDHFVQWVGEYLRNAAKQFAFSRIARISHGTVSPSNISWDGRWLDLSLARFLPGGANYTLRSQFYSEHSLALSYALELVHSYGKYNRLILNPEVLVRYYDEQFQAYLQHYTGYILGFNLSLIPSLPENAWIDVADTFIAVIHSGKGIDVRKPFPDENDPVIALIIASYLSLYDSAAAAPYYAVSGLSREESIKHRNDFLMVVDSYASEKQSDSVPPQKNLFFIPVLLRALKRAWLSEMWYMPEVHDRVASLCNNGVPEGIAPFIDNYDRMSDWAFSDDGREVVLCRSPALEIVYSIEGGEYILRYGDDSRSYYRFYCLYKAAMALPAYYFEINEFDFRKFLKRLSSVVSPVEKAVEEGREGEYVSEHL